jgi:hypothetical protein
VFNEDDQDLHVVSRTTQRIAPFFTVDTTAYRRKQMAAARDKVRICAKARVVRVVFWTARTTSQVGRRTRSSCTRSSASPASRVSDSAPWRLALLAAATWKSASPRRR